MFASNRQHMIELPVSALRGKGEARNDMDRLNENLRRLGDEDLKETMSSIAYVEPQNASAQIHSVRCTMQPQPIGEGYDLFVPSSFHVQIRCAIDAREQAIKGNFYFDREELKKFILKRFLKLTA